MDGSELTNASVMRLCRECVSVCVCVWFGFHREVWVEECGCVCAGVYLCVRVSACPCVCVRYQVVEVALLAGLWVRVDGKRGLRVVADADGREAGRGVREHHLKDARGVV